MNRNNLHPALVTWFILTLHLGTVPVKEGLVKTKSLLLMIEFVIAKVVVTDGDVKSTEVTTTSAISTKRS